MPDDNLFPDKPETAPSGTSPGNGADPTPAEPLTMEGAAELITQALQPVMAEVKAQGEAIQNVATGLSAPAAPAAPAPITEPQKDFLTQFSEDPELAIQKVGAAQMQTVIPFLSDLMNSGVSSFVGFESVEIDTEFGAGAWEKYFKAPMDQILDTYRTHNAAALANRETITKEVNGLKGKLLNDLVDYRTDSRKTASEKLDADNKELVDGVVGQVRTNLTGGLRRVEGATETVTDDMKGYLAERQAAIGGDESAKDWAKRTDYGNTLEDFLVHQKTMEKQ